MQKRHRHTYKQRFADIKKSNTKHTIQRYKHTDAECKQRFMKVVEEKLASRKKG